MLRRLCHLPGMCSSRHAVALACQVDSNHGRRRKQNKKGRQNKKKSKFDKGISFISARCVETVFVTSCAVHMICLNMLFSCGCNHTPIKSCDSISYSCAFWTTDIFSLLSVNTMTPSRNGEIEPLRPFRTAINRRLCWKLNYSTS